jgi:hypothetical protein
MATVAGVKIKIKAPKVRNALFMDEKYTGTEPLWDTEQALCWDDARFDHQLRQSFYYYGYYYNQKDSKKFITEWMRTRAEFTKPDCKAFEHAPDKAMPMTACSLARAYKRGMPMKPRHIEFMTQMIRKAISAAPELLEQSVDTSAPVSSTSLESGKLTIQDRLSERTSELLGELEGMFDEVVLNKKIVFKPYDFLTNNSVVQGQLGKYETLFLRHRTQLDQALNKVDVQLVEGYSNFKSADFKRLIAWIDTLLAAVEQYRGVKKATKKASIKKVPSKEKLISKVKYAKTDTALKIVSINPADILGAQVLWVYNSKTRKLGKYVAAAPLALSVKGTSIIGFDTDKSVAKTLRKPEDQLKAFAKSGKIALRSFLNDIRASEVKLNGRISADILLLRVE